MELQFSQKIIDSLGVPQIVDIRDQLPRHKQGSWADIAGFRQFADLDTIVIHHDGIAKSLRASWEPIPIIANIAQRHIESKKGYVEAGNPYHIQIIRGVAYYCNELSWRTYGVGDHNGHTIHVCVHGDFHNYDVLTDADRRCLIAVCLMLRDMKDVMPNLGYIAGHKEFAKTDCPGFDHNAVRQSVQDWEMRFARDNTLQARREVAYALKNQVDYMWGNIGKNDGDEEWSLNWFADFYDYLKSKEMIK